MAAETADVRSRFPVDDDALSALHARAFGTRGSTTSSWSRRLARHSIAWVGAFDGPRLVGFVHAVGDGGAHAFLLDTVVDPSWQRRGIGLAIVDRIQDDVAAAGVTWLHVDFEPHLAGFYAACGFRDTSAGLMRLGQPAAF